MRILASLLAMALLTGCVAYSGHGYYRSGHYGTGNGYYRDGYYRGGDGYYYRDGARYRYRYDNGRYYRDGHRRSR